MLYGIVFKAVEPVLVELLRFNPADVVTLKCCDAADASIVETTAMTANASPAAKNRSRHFLLIFFNVPLISFLPHRLAAHFSHFHAQRLYISINKHISID